MRQQGIMPKAQLHSFKYAANIQSTEEVKIVYRFNGGKDECSQQTTIIKRTLTDYYYY
jgi:hypothetical protein